MEEYMGNWREKAGLKPEPPQKKFYAGVQTKKGMWREGPFRTAERAKKMQKKMQKIAWGIK